MSSNKRVKELLIQRYGDKCFIERLHIRDTSNMKYTGCGQYKRMKQLTYHHIVEKSKGGKATIENGALLSEENHEWLHRQPKEVQRQLNSMFQELKRRIDYKECEIEYVDNIECPFETQFLEMCFNDNLEIKRAEIIRNKEERKNKRELQRLKKEYEDR